MGVPEMKVIASVIGQAVRDIDGLKTADIADQVHELVTKFPAYPRP